MSSATGGIPTTTQVPKNAQLLCWMVLKDIGWCWRILEDVGLFCKMLDDVGLFWVMLDGVGRMLNDIGRFRMMLDDVRSMDEVGWCSMMLNGVG